MAYGYPPEVEGADGFPPSVALVLLQRSRAARLLCRKLGWGNPVGVLAVVLRSVPDVPGHGPSQHQHGHAYAQGYGPPRVRRKAVGVHGPAKRRHYHESARVQPFQGYAHGHVPASVEPVVQRGHEGKPTRQSGSCRHQQQGQVEVPQLVDAAERDETAAKYEHPHHHYKTGTVFVGQVSGKRCGDGTLCPLKRPGETQLGGTPAEGVLHQNVPDGCPLEHRNDDYGVDE